ncbi:hypothetical protein P879_03695 [Paragonimus westermani]|uniref:Cation channel complex component UNC80 N-terminal domain-containing protein n=1 Tax=Paragonimus westermani TaxID=34504 RepID=A0A8T0DGM5_9TREM|nr:hypothetical protein P879_03695 [Paragonimus westermani]
MSRWQFIKTAFPHVLHCGSAMLREKLRNHMLNMQQYQRQLRTDQALLSASQAPLQFSQAETKLLYTLHWILLDAASECEDAELEGLAHRTASSRNGERRFLHDLSSLQLFIYLFAPLIEQLKAADFETLKLEAGLQIWIPLMAHRQPQIGTLSLPVKLFDLEHLFCSRAPVTSYGVPRTTCIADSTHMDSSGASSKTGIKKVGGIYIGEEDQSNSQKQLKPFELNEQIPSVEDNSGDSDEFESVNSKKPLTNYSIPNPSLSFVSASRNNELPIPPKAVPEATEEEDSATKSNHNPDVGTVKPDEQSVFGYARIQQILANETARYLAEQINIPANVDGTTTYFQNGAVSLLATHCDLAVIRCLYCAEWCEPGVNWSLTYLYKRLLLLRSERLRQDQETRRLLRLTRGGASLRELGATANLSMSDTLMFQLKSQSMPDLTVVSTPGRRQTGSIDSQRAHYQSVSQPKQIYDKNGHVGPTTSMQTNSHPFPTVSNGSALDLRPRSYGLDRRVIRKDSGGLRLTRSHFSADVKTSLDESTNLSLRTSDAFGGDSGLSLALPLVTFSGARLSSALSPSHQPSWKNSKRSRIADIKERFTRASKPKSGSDQTAKSGEVVGKPLIYYYTTRKALRSDPLQPPVLLSESSFTLISMKPTCQFFDIVHQVAIRDDLPERENSDR